MKHLETMHSTEEKSDDIPREDYNTSDDADTEELLIEDESTELELDDIVDGQSKGVELVLVKAAKRFWPAKIIEKKGKEVTIEKLDKRGTIQTVSEELLRPFEFDTKLFENCKNSELQAAYMKAKDLCEN